MGVRLFPTRQREPRVKITGPFSAPSTVLNPFSGSFLPCPAIPNGTPSSTRRARPTRSAALGTYGVYLFFVLSGASLAYNYDAARLRTVVAEAKAVNMPADNIKRAIQRGTGELPGVSYDEITYEAYGPGGVAIMIEVLTDNKNRTVGEMRHTLSKYGGNLGEANSVAWMFEKKGYIVVEKSKAEEDKLMTAAIEMARERLWVSTAYFVPGPELVAALTAAAARGVDVRVLTNGPRSASNRPPPRLRCCRRITSSSKASPRSRW